MKTLPVTIEAKSSGSLVKVEAFDASGNVVFSAKTRNSSGFVGRLDRMMIKGGLHRATGYAGVGSAMLAEGVFYPEVAAL